MNNSIICACKPNFYGPKCEFKLKSVIAASAVSSKSDRNDVTSREACLTNVCLNNGSCSIRRGKGKEKFSFY